MQLKYSIDKNVCNVIFKNKIDSSLNKQIERCKSDKKILFVYDKNISKKIVDKFLTSLSEIGCEVTAFEFKGNKKNKNEKSLFFLINVLINKNFTKNSILISLGGGVVGDICALASSLYYRGIIYFHIPTTMTAIIDSCIGGKTAINYKGIINCVGGYYHPSSVLIFNEIITNIPEREYKSGIPEILKCGLIKKNKILSILKNKRKDILDRNPTNILSVCKETLKTKIFFFKDDVREKNQRLNLNFGHTFAHSIEMSTDKIISTDIFRHGEAVGVGILAEILYSNFCKENNLFFETKKILESFNLPTNVSFFSKKFNKQKMHDAIFKNLFLDKKRIGKYPRYIKLNKVGQPHIGVMEDENLINSVISKII